VLLAGCESTPPSDSTQVDGPFADCAGVSAASAAPGDVPDLTLPCFHGGMSVRLTELDGPAVVNLWASWCEPCVKELPAFGKLAAKADGRVTVLGVVTRDTRESAASLADELGITFPTLFDERARLATALVEQKRATSALPVTVFIADGRVVYAYQGPALDEATLDQLVAEHLGVKV
jgi:thiol-disulfide isomerase/thioredoxin